MSKRVAFVFVSLLAAATVAPSSLAHADRDEMRPILNRLLTSYKACIFDEGIDPRKADRCVSGRTCTLDSRERTYRRLQAQADLGLDSGFSALLQSAILGDCFQCADHARWHTKHGHCSLHCGGTNDIQNGWLPGRGLCFEGCKAGVDFTRLAAEVGRAIGQVLGVVKPVEAADAIGGPRVSNNRRTIEASEMAREACTPVVVSRDYHVAPERMLDWTPTPVEPFRVTFIDSLKALLIGAVVGGLGLVAPLAGAFAGILAPFLPVVAGGITGLVASGLPSTLIGLPARPAAATRASMHRAEPGTIVGGNEGRLRSDLRAAARAASPVASLAQGAGFFARGDTGNGNAFSDLAVTGRASFGRFRRSPPTEAQILAVMRLVAPAAARLPADVQGRGARAALDRAFRVANLLRVGGWPTTCTAERNALGWIAVSGEDDQPHRPVNVPSAPFPQLDLNVPVRAGISVNTRYMIAHTNPPSAAPACGSSGRRLAADPVPVLARDAQVILLIHGMDSRLEEALDLTATLHRIGRATKQNWTVISVDLPTSGYAENIDHTRIAPLSADGEAKIRFNGKADLELTDLQVFNARGRHSVPMVDFIEDFIVAFVNRLDGVVPGVKARLKAVVGGSLGGNMAMRLGRRVGIDDWLRAVVPWSPAAIWPSYADGANPADHIVVAMPWMWAGGDPRQIAETPASRRSFFYLGFDWTMGLLNKKPQPKEWYREGWECKASHIVGSRLDRHETYNAKFRLWHWRLGAEQMLFSQQEIGGPRNRARYLDNNKKMLLMCGYDDTGADLCKHTREVAPKMTNTPGKALFLKETGHSIHNERPCWTAKHIVEFLGFPTADCSAR